MDTRDLVADLGAQLRAQRERAERAERQRDGLVSILRGVGPWMRLLVEQTEDLALGARHRLRGVEGVLDGLEQWERRLDEVCGAGGSRDGGGPPAL